MIYFLIYLLLYPYLFAMKKLKFKGEKGKILLIQTAKIGDYANSTVIFEKLGKFDVLIDEINLAFAKHDSRIEKIFTINGVKRKKTSKLGLALELFSRNYESVYVLMPNSLNLFIARCTLAKNIVAVHHYAASSDFALLALGMKKVPHTLQDLTLLTYLKTLGESELKYEKCLQKPLFIPQENLIKSGKFKIGVSLSAGNKMKMPPKHTWEKIFEIFAKFDCEVYIFGVGEEAALLKNLLAENTDKKQTENPSDGQICANLAGSDTSEICGDLKNANEEQPKAQICSESSTGGESNFSSQICDTYVKKFGENELKIISLIDKIKLEELPFYLSQMQLYASSDTGNYYVADSVRTPTICLMGPCFASEQRGVADSLVINSNLSPVSSVFKTVRDIDASAFFELSEQNLADIEAFVKVRYISYLSREDNFLC
ncbi:glycosyltransferase family 9 protein [Campylobacter sp. Marseille-Q3452]|uniref:Glycosyltransferase family 9 protein n=1 Tax=Campylobacter massiliensis TaxID=2762557 RepID=A0A842JA50_9BACT|nr:glycosyltransferase family 9 protein [Campylobacter massiliensis]MBC2883670.1 glycosyltransferase family 9 protein [Campylobacter massiliensis]